MSGLTNCLVRDVSRIFSFILITNYRQQDIIQEEAEIDYRDGDRATVSQIAQTHPWSSISTDRRYLNIGSHYILGEIGDLSLERKFTRRNLLILDNEKISWCNAR